MGGGSFNRAECLYTELAAAASSHVMTWLIRTDQAVYDFSKAVVVKLTRLGLHLVYGRTVYGYDRGLSMPYQSLNTYEHELFL